MVYEDKKTIEIIQWATSDAPKYWGDQKNELPTWML